MLLSPLNPIDIYKLRNALETVKSLCPFAKGEGSKEGNLAQWEALGGQGLLKRVAGRPGHRHHLQTVSGRLWTFDLLIAVSF